MKMRVTIAILTLLVTGMGCGGYSKTVRVEERAERTEPAGEPDTSVHEAAVARETTTVQRRESRGILSSTVHLIGQALALPFRLIAGFLETVF